MPPLQGSPERLRPGLVNFVTAVAYNFCLSLPAAFTQPGCSLLSGPCTQTNPSVFLPASLLPSSEVDARMGKTFLPAPKFGAPQCKIDKGRKRGGGERVQSSAERWAPGCVNAASKAEVVSNSSNKIHQTWGLPFSRALYSNCTGPKIITCCGLREIG